MQLNVKSPRCNNKQSGLTNTVKIKFSIYENGLQLQMTAIWKLSGIAIFDPPDYYYGPDMQVSPEFWGKQQRINWLWETLANQKHQAPLA